MTARSLLLLLAIPFSLPACSSDSFATPGDGGSDDAAADTAADTSSDVVAPPPDAGGGDGQTVDGGWKPPPPLVCASAPADAIFCADFDESNDPGSGWSSIFKLNGDVTLDLTNFYSSARAAKTVANGNPQSYGNLYQNNLDATHSHFALSYAFRVEAVDTAATVRVGQFTYPAVTTSSVSFDVVLGPGPGVGLSVVSTAGDGGTATSSFSLGSYKKGVWHHVVLDIKVKPAPVSIKASFDGAEQTFSPNISAAGGLTNNRDLHMGAQAETNMASPATIQIDDVLLRAF